MLKEFAGTVSGEDPISDSRVVPSLLCPLDGENSMS